MFFSWITANLIRKIRGKYWQTKRKVTKKKKERYTVARAQRNDLTLFLQVTHLGSWQSIHISRSFPTLSPTEIEQQGAQQFTLKSTVVDFKFLFSYSLHIKTCFTGGNIVNHSNFTLHAIPTRLAETCFLFNNCLKYSHSNKKKRDQGVCIWNLRWI